MKFASQTLGFFMLMILLGPKGAQANSDIGSCTNLNTLPVVVHVMHTGAPLGAPDNLSDSLIHEMIDLMNSAFQKDGSLYGGADIGFAFQLANRSPDCEISTGINRIDASGVADYVIGGITTDTNSFPNSAHEVFVKALSRWPNTDYINVWIVNKIDSNDFWPGGFAYFPEYNSAMTDGIVVRASVVNGTNKTIIHELGHYFSLYHTFHFDFMEPECENLNCMTNGDKICDTEPCVFTAECTGSINSCTDEEWIIVDIEHDYTVLNNYMGFTDCQWMFTEGQESRMQNALVSFRPGLLSSLALSGPEDMTPESACIPTADNDLSFFYGIERVEFGTLNVYSNTSHGDAAHYLDRTCNQHTWIEAGDSVVIRVTGSYENPVQVRVYLDMNNDGSFSVPDELILSGFDGIVEDTIEIPVLGISLCIPLRMRVVVDLPLAPDPSPCLLTGTLAEGVGQIEDYTVVITPRNVESVDSGDWDDPGAWSCNCIPGASDAVAINSGHVINIFPEMGIIECVEIELAPGAILNLDGEIRVTGGCL